MQSKVITLVMRIMVQVINTISIKQRGTTAKAVYFVTLAEQQLRQISAIRQLYP